MMADKSKLSITQRAITSPTGLGRTKQLPFEASEATAPKQTAQPLPEGTEFPLEETLPFNQLYITMKLPREVAILHVYQSGVDEYATLGGNANLGLPQTDPKERPNLSLGKLVQEKELPEKIRDAMYVFSFDNPELCKWLKTLRRRLGEQLCLVICDYTDFEIPWEMVGLSPDDSPNEYLGAVVTTVRWQPIRSKDDYLVLKPEPEECSGDAIAYVLDTELKGVGPELTILEQLRAVIYRSSKYDITTFQTHLQRQETSCGFIYISCHGGFSTNPSEIWIGSETDSLQRLKLLALRRCQLNLVRNSQGIVFINACHSGRHQAHPSIPKGYRMGFIELFLAKGARGVIGTLGAVGDSHAAKFAHDLIEESLRSPNLSVASLLRKLRLRVVENLPEQPTTQDLLPFIYTFMYVYYGNPMTVLRLTPPGGQPNV
jgi:hypothetical protein